MEITDLQKLCYRAVLEQVRAEYLKTKIRHVGITAPAMMSEPRAATARRGRRWRDVVVEYIDAAPPLL